MHKTTMYLYKVSELYGEKIVKSWFMDYDLENYLFPDQIATLNATKFFDKEMLATAIYDFYLEREIGYETPRLFEIKLKNKMRLLMRKYLPLFYSLAIQYDPLINVDFTETYDREVDAEQQNNGKTSSDSNGKSLSHNIYNDTPQTNIQIQRLNDGLYASSISTSETENSAGGITTAENAGTAKNIEHSERKQKGNSGSLTTAQALIKQYRDNIIEIEQMIIDDLSKLFIFLY